MSEPKDEVAAQLLKHKTVLLGEAAALVNLLPSRQVSLAITKIQEATFWLGFAFDMRCYKQNQHAADEFLAHLSEDSSDGTTN
jgi:hypothetical protein